MKNIVILGSTGSIGRQAVEVIKRHPKKFQVVGLAARNAELLVEQASQLGATYICLVRNNLIKQPQLRTPVTFLYGEEGLHELVSLREADVVLNAIVGSAGLPATLTAIQAGKAVALANKESLVAGGDMVKQALAVSESKIIPVDSEHSAVFQCLLGENTDKVSKIILTASGGPFWGRRWSELALVDPAEAVAHPRWRMGKKISVDSATLINKGLEAIEAHYLFDMPYDRIEIVVHPQSIVHSLVEFTDGSLKAHLGPTDMRLPIQYALSYPERLAPPLASLSLVEVGKLTFEPVDLANAPCLKLALQAARQGRSYPAVMSAANEEAVEAFLGERIRFTEIGEVIGAVLDEHEPRDINSLSIFKNIDAWARARAKEYVKARRR